MPSEKYSGFLYFLLALSLFFTLLFSTSCSTIALPNISEETNNKDIEVYFCPRDNCTEALYNFINSAQSSIHCAFFDLDLEEIINLLYKKSNNLEVKLVIDSYNYNNRLRGPGVVWENKSSYMHNKFCIIDNNKISTGSFNPTFTGAYKNNNNLLLINSKLLASNYEAEFNELWNKNFSKGNTTLNPTILLNKRIIKTYFCPEDLCSERIIHELRNARSSIYFMTFSFTHKKIANLLVLKHKEGLNIKGIFEKRQKSKYSMFNLFNFQNISVTWDSNPAAMHHKVFIIDKKTVITGSFNPSNNADKRNDENIIIIEDENLAKQYLEEFVLLTNS